MAKKDVSGRWENYPESIPSYLRGIQVPEWRPLSEQLEVVRYRSIRCVPNGGADGERR